MVDIAAIGIEYRTDGLEKGTRALRDNEKQANKTADAADGLTASIKRQSKSSLDHVHESERLIAKLKRQAETFGMTEAQIRRYEIAQMRGTAAQQKAVAHYVKHIEAVEALANAKRSATIAVASFAAAVPAVAGAFAALAKSQINAIDRFNDLNDATGASIENISALDRVARQNGSSFDTVSSVLVKFNSVLSKTDEDSDNAARVLKALGLNAEELKRIDPAESLHRTAVALSRFADDGNKARAAQILFGRSIAEVAPFMRDLSEQTKLMGVVSTQAARDAEAMNKTLFELKANTQDLVRAISLGLAPAISSLSDEFIVGTKHANGFFDAILTFGTLNPFRSQQGNMQALREELVQLGAARDRYLRSGSDTRGIDDAIRQSQRQLDYLKVAAGAPGAAGIVRHGRKRCRVPEVGPARGAVARNSWKAQKWHRQCARPIRRSNALFRNPPTPTRQDARTHRRRADAGRDSQRPDRQGECVAERAVAFHVAPDRPAA